MVRKPSTYSECNQVVTAKIVSSALLTRGRGGGVGGGLACRVSGNGTILPLQPLGE